MSTLISIILASRYPANVKALFDNLAETVSDPRNIEVLIKFDDDQDGIQTFIENEIKLRAFTIKYLITPRLEGYYSLWIAYQQLYEMSDPNSYFIQLLSDEPRFITSHWDTILKNYIGFFEDNIFRLRLSALKYTNYVTHYECTFRCDSFPITTRKWYELAEGMGDCWGPDAYHQCIAFHLALGSHNYINFYRADSECRDVAINDIQINGLEWGTGVNRKSQRIRHKKMLKEWRRLTTHHNQEKFSYLARRIYCHIWAHKNGIHDFKLIKNTKKRKVIVATTDNQEIYSTSYAVPFLIVITQNFIRSLFLSFWQTRYFIHYHFGKIIDALLKNKNGSITAADQGIKIQTIQKRSKTDRVKYFLRKIAINLNIIQHLSIYLYCRLFMPSSPGLACLNKITAHFPKSIKPPTEAQIKWAKVELLNIKKHKNKLETKIFDYL